jgi:hypothetical protein
MILLGDHKELERTNCSIYFSVSHRAYLASLGLVKVNREVFMGSFFTKAAGFSRAEFVACFDAGNGTGNSESPAGA